MNCVSWADGSAEAVDALASPNSTKTASNPTEDADLSVDITLRNDKVARWAGEVCTLRISQLLAQTLLGPSPFTTTAGEDAGRGQPPCREAHDPAGQGNVVRLLAGLGLPSTKRLQLPLALRETS